MVILKFFCSAVLLKFLKYIPDASQSSVLFIDSCLIVDLLWVGMVAGVSYVVILVTSLQKMTFELK